MSCKTTKEAYAVKRTVPPSAEIQANIDKLLSGGVVEDPSRVGACLAGPRAWMCLGLGRAEGAEGCWLAIQHRSASVSYDVDGASVFFDSTLAIGSSPSRAATASGQAVSPG
jgi:hypothetical protein